MSLNPPGIHKEWLDDSMRPRFSLEMRPYTLKELCSMFKMERRAFRNMIRKHESKIGEPSGRYYNVLQVETLMNCVGFPYVMKEE